MAQFFSIHPTHPQKRLVRQAAEIVRDGGVIAYPTDSCYALGCDRANAQGLERLRRIRGIDERHYLTLMCRDLSEMAKYAVVDDAQFQLMKSATPGSYTFILRARHFAPRAQDEGVAPGRRALHQLELRVVHDRVLGDLREITAHQRQVMTLVDAPDAAQALEPVRVAAVAAQRVAGVGRIGDDAAAAHDLRRLEHEALLGMGGVDREELGHQRARNSSSSRATACG